MSWHTPTSREGVPHRRAWDTPRCAGTHRPIGAKISCSSCEYGTWSVKHTVGRVDHPLAIVGMNHGGRLIARRVRLGGEAVDAIELRRPMGMRLATSHSQVPRCATPYVSTIRVSLRRRRSSFRFTSVISVDTHSHAKIPRSFRIGAIVHAYQQRTPAVPTSPHRRAGRRHSRGPQDGPRNPSASLIVLPSVQRSRAPAFPRTGPPLRVEDQHGIGAVPTTAERTRECLQGHAKPRSATLLHSRSRSERIGHARHLERSPFCSQVNVALKALGAPALGKRLSHPIPGAHCPALHTSPALQQPHPHWTVSGSQVIGRH